MKSMLFLILIFITGCSTMVKDSPEIEKILEDLIEEEFNVTISIFATVI